MALTTEDLLSVIHAEIAPRGLISHQIESFNDFLTKGLRQIICDIFRINMTFPNPRPNDPENADIEKISFNCTFENVKWKPPKYITTMNSVEKDLLPNLARRNNFNLTIEVMADIIINAKAYVKGSDVPLERNERLTQVPIASLPCMVRSAACHTYGKSKEELLALQEDPLDEGGYFILRGLEWVVDSIESMLFNAFRCYRNIGHDNEVCRGELISKPGDAFENSSSMIVRLLTNNALTIELAYLEMKDIQLPFFVFFRLLGAPHDEDIINMIVPDKSALESAKMLTMLESAFTTVEPSMQVFLTTFDATEIISLIALRVKSTMSTKTRGTGDDVESKSARNAKLMTLIDNYFLPHIGTDSASRWRKRMYLGHLIRTLFLVEQGIIPQTDRDSLESKRALSSGMAYSKAFKQQFNQSVITPIRSNLFNIFGKAPFATAPLGTTVRNAINIRRLEENMERAITTGDKETVQGNSRITKARMASQAYQRKNHTNTISVMRTIRTKSAQNVKVDQRAIDMRKVQPSYPGFYCLIQSADTGETVGMVKQMACTADICQSTSSLELVQYLLEDPEIIPLETIYERISTNENKGFARIMVNGYWIGSLQTNATHLFLRKYRELRRQSLSSPHIKLHPKTTIYWNSRVNDVYFWTDAGRLSRPLLVVRNNRGPLPTKYKEMLGAIKPDGNPNVFPKFKKSCNDLLNPEDFEQALVITREMINLINREKLTITDLHKMGVIDYITPDEQLNCHIAIDVNTLQENANNPLLEYTHCEIPPAVLGWPALITPNGGYTQLVRMVYADNQLKQAGGPYSLVAAYRTDKQRFSQHFIERPLLKTIANKYTIPNGVNAIVAVQCYTGNNQEDSTIFNETAIQRGLFGGTYFSYIQTIIESGEEVRTPDIENTRGLKKNCRYDKLVDGRVPPNTPLKQNDIVIGKRLLLPQPEKNIRYVDKSVSYKYDEDATTEDIIAETDQSGKKFIKVKYRAYRPPIVGNKFSSRFGQKGICGMILPQTDMPFTADGLIPDLIMNPHAFPSRMTPGQAIEGVFAKVAAIRGVTYDGTTFIRRDINAISDLLARLGFERRGREILHDGATGHPIEVLIFMTPIFIQLVQKFVKDQVYSVSNGRTCILTRQLVEGKSNQGGQRLGEMETWALVAHGATGFLREKILEDSDLFYIYVCRNCNHRANVNPDPPPVRINPLKPPIKPKPVYICRRCGDNASFVRCKMGWTNSLIFNELEGMQVDVSLLTTPIQTEKRM